MRLKCEGRGELGHFAPGAATPDRYDNAKRAKELRITTEIAEEVRTSWRPLKEFGMETKGGRRGDRKRSVEGGNFDVRPTGRSACWANSGYIHKRAAIQISRLRSRLVAGVGLFTQWPDVGF